MEEGEAALNEMFQKIYSDASDDAEKENFRKHKVPKLQRRPGEDGGHGDRNRRLRSDLFSNLKELNENCDDLTKSNK